ncbi:MAG: hypothetical protein HYX63_15275 [Gammaproteobacteria bacterium]|nr:hypothetical protein [Gammaproteobacteria bacterium]
MKLVKSIRPLIILALAYLLIPPVAADQFRGGARTDPQDYPSYTIPRPEPVLPTRPFFGDPYPRGNGNYGDNHGNNYRDRHHNGYGDSDDDDRGRSHHRHHGSHDFHDNYRNDGYNYRNGYGPYYSRPGMSIYYRSN